MVVWQGNSLGIDASMRGSTEVGQGKTGKEIFWVQEAVCVNVREDPSRYAERGIDKGFNAWGSSIREDQP